MKAPSTIRTVSNYTRKIEVVQGPEINAKGPRFRHLARAELSLEGGRQFEATAESARGSEQRFASPSDVLGKFETLTAKALPAEQHRELRDPILGLEGLLQAAELEPLLRSPVS